MSGRLILVATPIGNLGDMAPRAVAALEEAMQRELRMGSANGDENALPGVGGAGAAAAPKVGAVFVAAAAAVVRE